MSQPRRLFDCLAPLIKNAPHEALLSSKEGGAWRRWTTTEVKEAVDRLSAGLLSLGITAGDMSVEGRDKIALLSRNRPEWVILDLAVQQIGAVLVPIYPTAHINDLAFILNDASVKLVFANDEALFEKVQQARAGAPSIQDVYTFDEVPGARRWTELLELGRQEHFQAIETAAARIDTEDLFTIIYTSGTTGTPKGVMLSHHNVLSNVMATLPYFPIKQGTRSISFLPLNHIFERTVTYLYLFAGAHVHYPENLETLGEIIREVQPRMFSTVPRLLEKVYERILTKGQELTGLKRKLFFWALDLGFQYDIQKPGSAAYRLQLALANKLIFSKWREALGNNIDCIVTGSAACQVKLIRVFTAAGIPILEGYGLTETSPVISFNRLDPRQRMFGSVGTVIEDVEVKIAEDGEILCKGPNVMMGYYKRPDLTAEAIQDGWFHTGDIGTLVDSKFLRITDRKKEIFKTSGGKFVAPLPIENRLVESPYVEQVMVVGADRKFTGALIVPCFMAIRQWAQGKGIALPDNNSEVIRKPEVIELLKEAVEANNRHFSQVEQIKKFELLPSEWSIDGGEMTPTLKVKRKAILEKYRQQVEALYD